VTILQGGFLRTVGVEGEYSHESEHEGTLPVCSDIISSESESNDEEESDDKESGEKFQTRLSYRRNFITQLVGNVRNRNSRKRGRP
jgi:hypothetical protein